MATNTPNLNLILPDYSDTADVGVINDNFKKIDDFSGGGKVEEWLGDIQEKADASLAKISQDANTYLQSLQTEAAESLREIENKAKNALDSIPDDYETIYNDVSALKDHKADAIWDTSARAASHELNAQRGPMSVTLFGKTTETGTGDKSPENPYVISGVDKAWARAGNANYFYVEPAEKNGVTLTIDPITGEYILNGTARSNTYFNTKIKIPQGYVYTLSAEGTANAGLLIYIRNSASTSLSAMTKDQNGIQTITRGKSYVDSCELICLSGTTFNNYRIKVWLNNNAAAALPYEPYNANTLDLPLLPDGAPLMGNGTVDDTAENWVRSGCDKMIVLDGTHPIYKHSGYANVFYTAPNTALANSNTYCDQLPSRSLNEMLTSRGVAVDGYGAIMLNFGQYTTVDEVNAYLSANPLTVFYRSTAYTPEKDLRVTKVTRKRKTVTMDGSEAMWIQSINDAGLVNAQFVVGNNGWPAIDVASFKCTHFEKDAKSIADAASEGVYVYYDGIYLRINKDRLESADKTGVSKWLAEKKAAGNPVTLTYQIATPEIYMTDRRILRKPDLLTTDTTTVTGVGETAVEYPHDTKHYIDSKISELVTLALANS